MMRARDVLAVGIGRVGRASPALRALVRVRGRGLRAWGVGVAGALLAALVAGLPAIAVGASGRSLSRDAGAGARGWSSVPGSALGPVSAALGGDQPAYRVVGLRADNPAQRFGVVFSRAGVAVSQGPLRFALSLPALGRAGALPSIGMSVPVASGNRVAYGLSGAREWFANGPVGLEQGFDVSRAPAGFGH